MKPGIYESLLTARLQQALNANNDQVPDLQDVDKAEQPLVIARHLAGLIESALRATQATEARVAMVRDILAVLPDPAVLEEALYADEPGRIKRLDAVMPAGVTDSSRYIRPATPSLIAP